MIFSTEQRSRVLKFRMRELGIASLAELARRAGVDRGNLSTMIRTGVGLSVELRDRVADVLRIDRDQCAHLFDPAFDPAVVTVPIGIDLEPEDPVVLGKRSREAEKRRALRAGDTG